MKHYHVLGSKANLVGYVKFVDLMLSLSLQKNSDKKLLFSL